MSHYRDRRIDERSHSRGLDSLQKRSQVSFGAFQMIRVEYLFDCENFASCLMKNESLTREWLSFEKSGC